MKKSLLPFVLMLAPLAPQKDLILEKHGDRRRDEYFWLKERSSPGVIKYLKSENKFTEEMLKPSKKLEQTLFKEMKSHIKEDDSTYPVKDGPYYYYRRFEKNRQYQIFARKKGETGKEEILFDVNKLAKGHEFYSANYVYSPDHKWAAFSVDSTGRRFYDLRFKNLDTGKFLKTEIKDITDNVVWANDNKTIFYVKQNHDTLRWNQVYKFNLDSKKSELVFEEKEDTFELSLSDSLSQKHIFINSSSTLSSEVRVVDADAPAEMPRLLFAREKQHEFSVTEDDGFYYILSNKNARDFKILRTPFAKPSLENAEEWIPQRNGIHIDNLVVFKDQVALGSRSSGITQVEVINKKTRNIQKLAFQDSAYTVELGTNTEFDSPFLRYNYTSLRRPASIYDFEFATGSSHLRKTKEIPNYNMDDYVSDRIFAKARDGVMVPVSVLRRKSTKLDGTAPLLIYGYGSYGASMDPWFSSSVLSLVDRGFVFAIAHVRGGGEMGRQWTDDGRTLKKKNTFFDFIDCTEFLISQKMAAPKKIFAMGGSAGGLLMGAIANMRPDLYTGIVAEVPFVDVLTTMLDNTIPLTTAEYDEWGNPNEKNLYDYIKTYSPYDNVVAQNYPNILVTTGLHDSQVQYWEPAKWVARLRQKNTAKSLILLKTDMKAGHGGKSGRFDQLREDAFNYAFILQLLPR